MPLTDLSVRAAKTKAVAYKLADSSGLYLLIKPGGGKLWRLDYRFGGKRNAPSMPPPRHGEHTRAILRDLGYSDDDVAQLVSARVAHAA
jgi:crotonobetainyl-CoA:carnitine CoA-transferase CaiB-like acyl-CoA transferase